MWPNSEQSRSAGPLDGRRRATRNGIFLAHKFAPNEGRTYTPSGPARGRLAVSRLRSTDRARRALSAQSVIPPRRRCGRARYFSDRVTRGTAANSLNSPLDRSFAACSTAAAVRYLTQITPLRDCAIVPAESEGDWGIVGRDVLAFDCWSKGWRWEAPWIAVQAYLY